MKPHKIKELRFIKGICEAGELITVASNKNDFFLLLVEKDSYSDRLYVSLFDETFFLDDMKRSI